MTACSGIVVQIALVTGGCVLKQLPICSWSFFISQMMSVITREVLGSA